MPSHSTHRRGWRAFAVAVSLAILPLSAVPTLANGGPGLDPASVDKVLFPGEQIDVQKTVTTPAIAPKPDIYFLADTTGSMYSAIGTVQTNATTVLAAIDGATADPRYGAGDYKDFPYDAYAFNNAAPIPGSDDNGAAALAAIGAWSAGGGYDGPEAQLYALDQVAGTANFRSDATRIVVWFGDSPGHDPVCSAISGLGYDVTEASVTAKLVAAGIRVVAISLVTGYPAGLNDDPTLWAGDYFADCGAAGGSSGQATRIAAATGGVVLTGVGPDEIAAAILTGLESLPVTVAMESDCGAPIHTSFSPATLDVTSGTDAVFTETISVDSNAPGGSYECKDWATIDGQPMTDVTGAVIYELKTIKVPEGYLTGGGQIVEGSKKDAAKISFGGNVGFLADFSLVGQWQTIFHNVTGTALDGGMFHSTAITSLQFVMTCGPAPSPPPANANWSNFTATGRFNGEDGWSVDVRAADYGEPGKDNDSFRILLYNPSATLVYDSYAGGTPAGDFPANDVCSGVDSVRHQLDAGNLQIHSGVKGL